jgi:ActD protein
MSAPDFAHGIYGLLGEFSRPEELVDAARRARLVGFRHFEAYTPFPIDELPDVLHLRRSKLPLVVLVGGIVGFALGLGFQFWASAVDYPLNVGGRPEASWPAFIPVTFEVTILFAALAAVLGFFWSCRLPEPYHPLFNAGRFALASRDRFFLCIEADDRHYGEARRFFESVGAQHVEEVPL